MGEAGSPSRGEDRRTSSGRSVQVDGRNGSLATLRHGFKCYGRTLRAAFFKAAHGLNAELEAALRGQPRRDHPPAPLFPGVGEIARHRVEPQRHPGRHGRAEEPAHRPDRRGCRRPVPTRPRSARADFAFKQRTLVHFAVDTEAVIMTTRLAGRATRFLPFDKGNDGGAGNLLDPAGRSYRTAYLWEDVLGRATACSTYGPVSSICRSRRSGMTGGPQGEGRIDDLPALSPARRGAHAGPSGTPRRRRRELPDRAFRRQRQEQHYRLARPPPRLAARRRRREDIRQRDRGHRPGGARPAASGHDLPVRAQARASSRRSTRVRASSPKRSKAACRSLSPRCRSFPSYRGNC